MNFIWRCIETVAKLVLWTMLCALAALFFLVLFGCATPAKPVDPAVYLPNGVIVDPRDVPPGLNAVHESPNPR